MSASNLCNGQSAVLVGVLFVVLLQQLGVLAVIVKRFMGVSCTVPSWSMPDLYLFLRVSDTRCKHAGGIRDQPQADRKQGKRCTTRASLM